MSRSRGDDDTGFLILVVLVALALDYCGNADNEQRLGRRLMFTQLDLFAARHAALACPAERAP